MQEPRLCSRFGRGEKRCQIRTAGMFEFRCGSFYISGQPCCNSETILY